jgi:hypothetical protein
MGAAARLEAQGYAWEKTAREIEELFTSLVIKTT